MLTTMTVPCRRRCQKRSGSRLLCCFWFPLVLVPSVTTALLPGGGGTASSSFRDERRPLSLFQRTPRGQLHPSRSSQSPPRTATLSADAPKPETTSDDDDDDVVLKTVTVDLAGARRYPIYVGSSLLDGKNVPWAEQIASKKCLVVSDETVATLGYLSRCVDALERAGKDVHHVIVPAGETSKSIEKLSHILDKALEYKLDRKSTIVALGGGVVGDLAGFAAAVYVRGVNFVQIPTTLMAMVDSSVGGKTGVNHERGKNMIGAFHQPSTVVADLTTLQTLPRREFASGVAEIVKYGLIRDAEFFEWLEKNGNVEKLETDFNVLAEAVERSCQNKAAVVAADEKESSGLRATLNLGHTFGHAIETRAGYGAYCHGEAVAIGTVMANRLSVKMGWIDAALESRATEVLRRANLPVDLKGSNLVKGNHDTSIVDDFLDLMSLDKKVADGQLRLILLKGDLGNCVFTSDFDPALLRETLEEFLLVE